MSRPSLNKTNIARLRELLGMTQKDLATIAGCSWTSIRSIEHGKLGLSRRLAERIMAQTDVSADWLLRNDLGESPVSRLGAPYSKADFARHELRNVSIDPALAVHFLMGILDDVSKILISAAADGKLTIATWRLIETIGKVGAEFGLPDDTWPFDPETGTWTRQAPHPKDVTRFLDVFQKRITKAVKASKK